MGPQSWSFSDLTDGLSIAKVDIHQFVFEQIMNTLAFLSQHLSLENCMNHKPKVMMFIIFKYLNDFFDQTLKTTCLRVSCISTDVISWSLYETHICPRDKSVIVTMGCMVFAMFHWGILDWWRSDLDAFIMVQYTVYDFFLENYL